MGVGFSDGLLFLGNVCTSMTSCVLITIEFDQNIELLPSNIISLQTYIEVLICLKLETLFQN